MHDPMTLIYGCRFFDLWHVDPEKGGSDDSCGFSTPRLTTKQIDRLKGAAWNESRYPYFLRSPFKEWNGDRHEAESLYRGMLLLISDALGIRLTFEEAARMAARAIHNPDCSDAASRFCFVPGYHSNFAGDDPVYREDHFLGILCGNARWILRTKRRWWQSPKLHFWHWKLNIHAVLDFKRWAWSRCVKCGGRFPWGYAPISHNWDSSGPRWFKSEHGIYHHQCSGAAVAASKQTTE